MKARIIELGYKAIEINYHGSLFHLQVPTYSYNLLNMDENNILEQLVEKINKGYDQNNQTHEDRNDNKK